MTSSSETTDSTAGPSSSNIGLQLFRAMGLAENGGPKIGPNQLGVRFGVDIYSDSGGNVVPGIGGMSVTPNDPMDLPLHRLPEKFGGTGKRPIWWIDERKLLPALTYRPDPRSRKHGFVEPANVMSVNDYIIAIEETAPNWNIHA